MVSPAEIQALFALESAISNRKVDETGEVAKVWAHVLRDVTWADATEALAAHLRDTGGWLEPKHILDRVRRIRAKRIADHPPLIPPPGLDVTQELRWLADAKQRVGNGEVIDCDAAFGELVTGPSVNFRELLPTPDTLPETQPTKETR